MRDGLSLETRSTVALATGDEFELHNPHPIADKLPGVFRESWLDEQRRTAREPFGTRFLSALDTVLAPVLATLDSLESYFDADTTPEDFLAWLGSWVAASVDAGWPEDRRRAFVGQAAELYRRRGTAAGLRDHVQIHTGGVVEIVENGASSWSATAEGKLPGTPEPVVIIRVTVDDPDAIDKVKLESLVANSKPAHVVHRVEVLGTAQRAGRAKAATVQSVASEAPAADTTVTSKTSTDEVMPTAPAQGAATPADDAPATAPEPPVAKAKAPGRTTPTADPGDGNAEATASPDPDPAQEKPAAKASSTDAVDAAKEGAADPQADAPEPPSASADDEPKG
jgi:phage tail-like protein